MKMSTQLAIFFIAFNGIAAVVMGMGVAQELGINAETGNPDGLQPDTVSEKQAAGDGPQLGSTNQGTLFGMYNKLSDGVLTLFYSAAPGFAMLRSFLPNIWIDLVLSPVASIVITKDVIAFARGTDL
jgi:hypothetical protein